MARKGDVDLRERLSVDLSVCHGKPCNKAARIMRSILLAYLQAGESRKEILLQYPTLKPGISMLLSAIPSR
jgi:uncharacterized protein (DUF433 family)